MTPWPTHIYRIKSAHLHESRRIALLQQISDTNQHGLPPILTLKHLSLLTHTNYRFLRGIVGRKVLCYKSIKIKKKNSRGKRTIHIPFFQLEKLQKWIDRYLLANIPIHHRAFAYRSGYSIKDCALQHCGARWIVKIDIKHFFESISEPMVYNIFRECGYGELISFELTRLCTYAEYNEDDIACDASEKYSISLYNSNATGVVVQGASSSPRLSNIVMRDIDEKIFQYCIQNNVVYTRYSDDLIFSSSDNNFCRDSAFLLKKYIYSILKEHNFTPNENKFSIISPGGRKLVLGLLVDREQPRLTPEFKEKIKQHLYFLNKNVDIHRKRMKFKTIPGLKNHIDGLMNYIHDIDEDFHKKILVKYQAITWPI